MRFVIQDKTRGRVKKPVKLYAGMKTFLATTATNASQSLNGATDSLSAMTTPTRLCAVSAERTKRSQTRGISHPLARFLRQELTLYLAEQKGLS